MVPVCLLAIIYFATIFFGGAHVWSRSILILSAFGCSLAGLVRWFVLNFKDSNRRLKIVIDPPSIAGIFFVLWVAVQVIPVPSAIIHVLSPKSEILWESTKIISDNFSSFISLYPFMTVNSLIFAVSVLLFYWFALYGLRSRQQIQWLILGLLALGLFESVYGLFQLVMEEPHILWWEKAYYVDVATGTFINRNHLAGFLSMLICLGVGYLWTLGREEKRIFRKRSWYDRMEGWGRTFGTKGVIVLLCIAVMITGLLGSASRGGILSLLTGLIFMIGLIVARFFKSKNAFVFVFLLSVVCMYAGYVAADRVIERFQHAESGFESRLAMTRATWVMGNDFPLTGTGLGTFEYVFPGYQHTWTNKLIEYAHNDWVQLFAETGWVGFFIVALGLVLFLIFSVVRWRSRRNSFSVGTGLGGMGALVAISTHSLSDFNLHMPANAFLLALIVAITYLSLYSEKHHRAKDFSYSGINSRTSLWTSVALIIIVAAGGLLIGKNVIRVWQADILARTFRNSTIPFVNPTDHELKRAWELTPGNATYWSWMADRIFAHPEKKSKLVADTNIRTHDPDIHLWSEGIGRNPTAWWIWRELGWGAFAKQRKDPDYYLPLAVKAIERASELRPYSSQGYMEAGTVALVHHAYSQEKESILWKEKFRKALALKPVLAPKVADQLVLYLGRNGAYEIKDLLPDDFKSYILTSRYLLKEGYLDSGISILKVGELKRREKIDGLWVEFNKYGRWSRKKGKKILQEILSVDPRNPTALLFKGQVLKALKSQEQRSNGLDSLGSLKSIIWKLRELRETENGSPVEISYFLGRIAGEEKKIKEAETEYQNALRLNPQYFPAWIHLRGILAKNSKTAGDRIELEILEKKIQLFSMDRIVADAWKWAGNYGGLPSWKALFRIDSALKGFQIAFSGDEKGAWKLILDGQFIEAWSGLKWKENKKIKIPAGEHELRLVYYGNVYPWEKKNLPFRLKIAFQK